MERDQREPQKPRPRRAKKVMHCTHCVYECTKSNQLKRHATVHTTNRPHKCNWCNYAAKDKGTLKRHTRTHMDARPYRCKQCDFSAKQLYVLERHVRTHAGIKEKERMSKVCEFENCSFKTLYAWNLRKHIRRLHSEEKPGFTCTYCDYATYSGYELRRHMMRKHISWSPEIFQCEICHYKTFQEEELRKHRATRHFGDSGPNDDLKRGMETEEAPDVVEMEVRTETEATREALQEEMESYFHNQAFGERMPVKVELQIPFNCKYCEYVAEDQFMAIHNEEVHSLPFVELKLWPSVQ